MVNWIYILMAVAGAAVWTFLILYFGNHFSEKKEIGTSKEDSGATEG